MTIFTEPEENYCFSIIALVIIRATALSFILLDFSLKTSRNRVAAILKISTSVIIIITSREVIIARYDVILDQSERMHLYNHLSNYTKDG